MSEGYKNESPFPFIVIDNFFKENVITEIVDNVEKLETNNANYKFYDGAWELNKYAFERNFGSYLENIFTTLNSDEFIDNLEKLTGIKNIIRNDTTLKGAGVHRILKDGILKVHTDFNYYDSGKYGRLDRRLNLLIYLNSDWKDEYNGHLLLCNRFTHEIKYKIAPIINRCVIFNTTKNSLHGHPYPLNTPEDVKRHSIAVYYYTKNDDGIDFEGDGERPTLIFNCDDYNQTNMVSI
uniref:Prolyl 4-hydroxylase alpha subunit Fe(2+) 2OG dioxygenase domain-containing protein n=1 Tax=viral metagenome TaxID=1070528 RepID=A0A6C0HYF5_9ZZZZ